MTKLVMNADLFRIAYACVSTEETRYYLNGVQVERHPQRGLLYISTDGHRLLVVHDADATALDLPKGGVILRAVPAQLKIFKRAKWCDSLRMTVTLSDNVNGPQDCALADVVNATKEKPEQITPQGTIMLARIDGSFPDWRRVVPRLETHGPFPAFRAKYAADFEQVGRDLAKALGSDANYASMSINGQGAAGPALVSWGAHPALGVLMPLAAAHPVAVFPDFLKTGGKRQDVA